MSAKPAKTVYLGMSGGVDSSVSAILLKEQGYKVVGVYMKNWSRDLPGMKCPWAEDLADAKRVAVDLDIDFEVWDFEKDYKQKVVDYMLAEFKKGRTPNPDIMCNQEIKFKLFYETALSHGADFIATGHYAQVNLGAGPAAASSPTALSLVGVPQAASPAPTLLRAVDENKDQTYFLYRISDEALSRTIFPIGHLKKPEVKRIAAEHGFANAHKKESMGVCFVGEVGMKDFLKSYIDIKPGEIREQETNKLLGHHEGAIFYTIGQRHGLYVGGGLPYYVVEKDLTKNILYVSKDLNHSALWTTELELEDVIVRNEGDVFLREFGARQCENQRRTPVATGRADAARKSISSSLTVRLRHRAPLIPCEFDGHKIIFKEPIKRPASGQSAVLYIGKVCVGGGIIK